MKPIAITAVWEHLVREAQRTEAEHEGLECVQFSLHSTEDKTSCLRCSAFAENQLVTGCGHTPVAALKDMLSKIPCKTNP